jgi:tetrapyrrole methylase family protein/MazG family protein
LYIPPLSPQASFESFQEVISRLRAPDGCPWDREQTHRSLRPFLIEEAYEALEALDLGDMAALEEELGNLLLQILLHAQIAAEAGEFNIHHVLEGIGTKLIRRHPHVFSEVSVEGVSGVIQNWEAIKADERKENGASAKKGLLDGVPSALPALLQAQEIIERVQRVGLNPWGNEESRKELCDTLDQLLMGGEHPKEEIFGKLLFTLTALAHSQDIDAESVLREAISRFRKHLGEIESSVLASGKSLSGLSKADRAQLWSDFSIEERDQ